MGISELRQAAVARRSEVRGQETEVRSQRSEFSAARVRYDLLVFAAFAMLLLFILLTRAVLWEWAPLAEWDRVCCERLHQHGRTAPSLVAFLQAFTYLASTRMLFLETTLIALMLAVCRHWRLALAWMTSICTGYLLVHVLKAVVGKPRPVFPDPFEFPINGSFPSGHTAGAVLVFGLLAYLLARFWPNRRWASYAGCSALILAIGFSRVYLGAHWFSDVVGGIVIGMACNLVAIAVMERVKERNPPTPFSKTEGGAVISPIPLRERG